jgi:hypothetical protein
VTEKEQGWLSQTIETEPSSSKFRRRTQSWPEHVEACANCRGEPSRHAYGARGYCNRCYRVIRHIERVQTWNRSDRETLKGIPKDGLFDPTVGYHRSTRLITDSCTDAEFEIVRQECIRQLERRLARLCGREEIRRHEMPVDAWRLEQKFAELLHLIRPKGQYPRNASYLSHHFNEAERRVIYGLLEEIIEHAPPRPRIQWWRVYQSISTYNKQHARPDGQKHKQ